MLQKIIDNQERMLSILETLVNPFYPPHKPSSMYPSYPLTPAFYPSPYAPLHLTYSVPHSPTAASYPASLQMLPGLGVKWAGLHGVRAPTDTEILTLRLLLTFLRPPALLLLSHHSPIHLPQTLLLLIFPLLPPHVLLYCLRTTLWGSIQNWEGTIKWGNFQWHWHGRAFLEKTWWELALLGGKYMASPPYPLMASRKSDESFSPSARLITTTRLYSRIQCGANVKPLSIMLALNIA